MKFIVKLVDEIRQIGPDLRAEVLSAKRKVSREVREGKSLI
jgi:hypothetical protein